MVPLVVDEKSRITRGIIPPRVLVVDAEPLICWSLCSALDAAGFDATAAADVADATRLAMQWPPPKVVLFELQGGDPTGRELLTAVRSVYPDCRFVVMTTEHAWPPPWIAAEGVEWIQKPFDLSDVVRIVSDLSMRALAHPSTTPAAGIV